MTTSSGFNIANAHMDKLKVPLQELEDYRRILFEIVGLNGFVVESPVNKLSVPLGDLKEYNILLKEVLSKLKRIEKFHIQNVERK